MIYADDAIGIILIAIIQKKIEQYAAVFSAAEGNENVFKFAEQILQTLQRCFVNRLVQILSAQYNVLLKKEFFTNYIIFRKKNQDKKEKNGKRGNDCF